MWAADNWKNSELLKVRQIILKIFLCGNVKTQEVLKRNRHAHY